MKRLFIILLIVIGTIQFGIKRLNIELPGLAQREHADAGTPSRSSSTSYATPADGSQFAGSGRVTRILSDDNVGSRHQRFILTLPSNQTILIAHNIDLAPRVPDLRVGDTISFNGVYEHNSKGGVVHWTHHDPKGRHTPGWLKKNGRTYQ